VLLNPFDSIPIPDTADEMITYWSTRPFAPGAIDDPQDDRGPTLLELVQALIDSAGETRGRSAVGDELQLLACLGPCHGPIDRCRDGRLAEFVSDGHLDAEHRHLDDGEPCEHGISVTDVLAARDGRRSR
jgi:hypothetical protein